MFWDNFSALCKGVGKAPNAVIRENGWGGTSTATYWKKRKSTPRPETLQQIASYFGVTVEYLLNDEEAKEAPAAKSEAGKINAHYFDLSLEDRQTIDKIIESLYSANKDAD